VGVSVRDVAAAAAVSVGTVSNVLNRPAKVAPATVERVMQAIDDLGFVRNDAARQLRAGRSRSIGIVVLDVGNPFFAEVVRGAETRAAEEGMSVLVGNSDESADREGGYLDLFREQRVNGLLITPASSDVPRLQRVQDAGIPVILVDSEIGDGRFVSVAVDDVEGGYLAAAHLLASGRRRLAFVAGPWSIRQVSDRLEGARRAVAEVSGAALEVIESAALTVLHGRTAGQVLTARPAADRPDAVFAANDLLAVGVLQAFSATPDISVPGDIALIGYDDIDFAASTTVPLSSVRQPAHLLGYTAVDLLMKELDDASGDRHVRFQPELVARQSTAG
jgi:LacI family transcriptional regulator